LNVGPIPALRVLTADGRLLSSHDGYVEADRLVEFLTGAFDSAAPPDDVLVGVGPPTLLEVVKLVRQFNDRDARVREAAIHRLTPFPQLASAAVTKALTTGNLSSKLAAYELLHQWRAPLGDIDPWRPRSLTDERKAALEKWTSATAKEGFAHDPNEVSDAVLDQVRQDIEQMLNADASGAIAIRERLARAGSSILPFVTARLKETSDDERRQRLVSLRYR
jgi:hypothetical protein